MQKKTNNIQQEEGAALLIDDTDRKLLSLLAKDANQSYSELGKIVHLSAPAVHERVKRLKANGVIKGTVALIDGAKIGRPLLAFISVNTKNWTTTRQLLQLTEVADIEEIHTVTGDNAMMIKVRTRNTQALENLLGIIHGIEGIEGTCSQIVLSTYLERQPSSTV